MFFTPLTHLHTMLPQDFEHTWPGAVDVVTWLVVVMEVVLTCILYRENLLSVAVTSALVASAALSLGLRWLVAILHGKSAALLNSLDSASENFTVIMVALEAEHRAHSDTKGDHEATRVRLRDKTAEANAARLQARHLRATARAAEASNASLIAEIACREGEVDTAMAKLVKEEGKHAATRARLDSAEEKSTTTADHLQAVTERCEKVEDELAVATEQRSGAWQKTAALTSSLDSRTKELRSSEAKLAAMTAALHGKDVELLAACGRLAVCAAKRREGKDQLAAMTAELLGEKAKTSSLAAALGTAREGLAAKDAVIERQSAKISEGMLLMADQGNAALVLKRQLVESRTKLDSALFELELGKRAGIAMKGTVTNLTNKVATLQTSVGSLHLPAHHLSGIDDSSDGKKNAAASEVSTDTSTDTTPSTLSPPTSIRISSSSSSSSSSIDGVNSISHDGSGSDSGSDSVRPVDVESTPAPAAPCSPTDAEAPPAVVHTGAHNRPGRQRRGQRGQHGGTPQLRSTKATKAKRQTLSRYFC